MLEIWCTGTAHEIGVTHGGQAREKILGSIDFYRQLFQKSCSLSWDEVTQEASRYVEPLEKISPRYLEEIRGIAVGAEVPFLDILALNVRTEINFGLFSDSTKNNATELPSDGCTALSWLTETRSFLGQNWDWMVEQATNLIICHVSQPGTGIPDFAMVTEAGIVGKIGINANGVGCCLNAIKCRGVDRSKLPIHFALRAVLESTSRAAATKAIKAAGVAGSGHILIGDGTGSSGLECTSIWVKEIEMDSSRRICHTNHLLLEHDDVNEPGWLADSPVRLARIQELTSNESVPSTLDEMFDFFKDTEGYPTSIDRKQLGACTSETLFTIVMDLTSKMAQVTFGRPTESKNVILLAFEK